VHLGWAYRNDGALGNVPGGFATPDDVEALELVQQGLANWQDDRWTEMSRGMGREGDQLNSDEHHLRIFWRKWNQLMDVA
jgi:p-cumate 2,3-dioxygenase subunit alpha